MTTIQVGRVRFLSGLDVRKLREEISLSTRCAKLGRCEAVAVSYHLGESLLL